MLPEATQAYETELDRFVQAYESAHACAGHADLRAFLPEPQHPLHRPVLRELVRVDLEYSWERGQPKRLAEYQRSFPELFEDPESLHAIAFEEYRLRQQAGENVSPEEYERRFGIGTADWPRSWQADNGPTEYPADPAAEEHATVGLHGVPHDTLREHAEVFEELHRLDPKAAERLAQAAAHMPRAGSDFWDFRLLDELGRGAFARVFLAKQADLASRLVVLKIAPDLAGESQTLAQLQHTHIVPIYSLHRAGLFQAVCMPYFGATTLADVLKDVRTHKALPTTGQGFVAAVEGRRRMEDRGWRIEDGGSNPVPSVELLSSILHPPSGRVRSTHATARVRSAHATAADNLKALAGRTYVEAVLWMAVRLADGLAHAHERGIFHRDLKPANILLTDDGQPMLLDFNLSADTKLRQSASAARIGGTLAYMAPEHLEAFQGGTRPVDARSDVYALGVILYELLSGRIPFEKQTGPLRLVLERMRAERLQRPPDLRRWSSAISPALASIIRHCLEPEPASRYQSAQELREDLQRQLDQQPLRFAPEPSLLERAQKWRRRHPRLTSLTSVTAIATVLLISLVSVLVVRHGHLARLEALTSLHEVGEELQNIRFLLGTPEAEPKQWREGFAKGHRILDRYHVLGTATWLEEALRPLPAKEGQRLRDDMGEILLLMAQTQARGAEAISTPAARQEELAFAVQLNTLAEGCYPPGETPRALVLQRAGLTRLQGDADLARRLREQALVLPVSNPRDRYLLLADHLAHSEVRQSLVYVREACRNQPDNFAWWIMLGVCQAALGQPEEAAGSYSRGISLNPQAHWAYFNRAVLYLEQKRDYRHALDDFDEFIRLRPDVPAAYYNRAIAKDRLGDLAGALADLNHMVEEGDAPVRTYFLRARVREKMGDRPGAGLDRQEGLRRKPTDERDWVVRGLARLPKDPQGAVADFDEALLLNPRSRSALQNKASVLAEHLGRAAEAVPLLDKVISLYPDYPRARPGRGVLLARLGRREAALADATESLRRDPDPHTLYQVAGIYALTSVQNPDDRREAFRLLGSALRKGFGLELLEKDRELDPIREQPEFGRLVEAAKVLRGGAAPKAGNP